MNQHALPPPLKKGKSTALYKKMTANHLIPRAGTSDEAAKGILFVIENDFVTGTTVDAEGGLMLS